MQFHSGNVYHVYNRGNNQQQLFFEQENYLYFLGKVRQYLVPHCDILAYALMPNHFHFLIEAVDRSEKLTAGNRITKNAVSEGIRLLLSSYTKGINSHQNRTGNLFQQKTKSCCVFEPTNTNYVETCLHYIHQNPFRAGLVKKIEDWPYSSFPDYAGLRNGTLCNMQKGYGWLESNPDDFRIHSYGAISEDAIKQLYRTPPI